MEDNTAKNYILSILGVPLEIVELDDDMLQFCIDKAKSEFKLDLGHTLNQEMIQERSLIEAMVVLYTIRRMYTYGIHEIKNNKLHETYKEKLEQWNLKLKKLQGN